MARRWWRAGNLPPPDPNIEIKEVGRHNLQYEKGWRVKMFSNGFGAFCTAIVMLVFAVTKFRDGAWAVLIRTPILMGIFLWIHKHYVTVATSLSGTLWGAPAL